MRTSISKRPMGVGNRAALRTAKVFPGLPGLLFSAAAVPWDSLGCLAVAELAEMLVPQGSPIYAGSGTALVTESWLSWERKVDVEVKGNGSLNVYDGGCMVWGSL